MYHHEWVAFQLCPYADRNTAQSMSVVHARVTDSRTGVHNPRCPNLAQSAAIEERTLYFHCLGVSAVCLAFGVVRGAAAHKTLNLLWVVEYSTLLCLSAKGLRKTAHSLRPSCPRQTKREAQLGLFLWLDKTEKQHCSSSDHGTVARRSRNVRPCETPACGKLVAWVCGRDLACLLAPATRWHLGRMWAVFLSPIIVLSWNLDGSEQN